MSGHFDDAALNVRPSDTISGMSSTALKVCAVGVIATVAGFFVEREIFFQSYLIAFIFWLSISLGSLALLMVQHLSGGAWGIVSRRVFESAARTLPLMALLFLPIAFDVHHLFAWARPEALTDPIIMQKAAFLNVPFFYIRAVVYFTIWIGLMWRLTSWSAAQDEAPQLLPGPEDRKFRVFSGRGLVLFMLTVTGMSVDWIMSLDPHWYSTIIGVLSVGGEGLSTLAFTIVILAALSKVKPMSDVMVPERFHDLGKLMFAFVMLWAYFSVSQLIIVWSANLPEEIPFYLKRFNGPWGWVSVVVLVGHFIVPFSFLLSTRIKRTPALAARIALFILAMRAVEIAWMMAPMMREGTHNGPSWLDFAAVLGLGALWLPFFFRNLASRAIVPVHDPYLKDVLHGGH